MEFFGIDDLEQYICCHVLSFEGSEGCLLKLF